MSVGTELNQLIPVIFCVCATFSLCVCMNLLKHSQISYSLEWPLECIPNENDAQARTHTYMVAKLMEIWM